MKRQFIEWTPMKPAVRERLAEASAVIDHWTSLGYRLTLRQLYYQLVSRGAIDNTVREYKNLSVTITNARMAGLIDWDHIEDRSRNALMPSHWAGASDILRDAAEYFRMDRWAGQRRHVEVWCEKDALTSVLEPVAREYHVLLLPVRGYSSTTIAYEASLRFEAVFPKDPLVLYLGDHDPSGVDMTRDLEGRLSEFAGAGGVELRRLALNHDQVLDHALPPNPTKSSDSRAAAYTEAYGTECWELDALDPPTVVSVVRDAIEAELERQLYDGRVVEEESVKTQLRAFANAVGTP